MLAVERLALEGEVARLALVLERREDVARRRRPAPAQDLDRRRWAGGRDLPAALVEHRPHASRMLSRDEGVAHAQRPVLHQHAHDDAAPLLHTRFEHDALGPA